MSDTLYRYILMLRLIPRAPRKVDAGMIQSRLLDDYNIRITRRSVQRDLNKLSAWFPIIGDQNKPSGWSWMKNADGLDIPALDPHAALTFQLVGEFLAPLLPRPTLSHLEPHLKRAREVLRGLSTEGLSDWPAKVRVIPRGLPMLPPRIDPQVHSAIYEALLDNRQIKVKYKARGMPEARNHTLHPLGLVYRENMPYMVCMMDAIDHPIHLPVHRITEASLLSRSVKAPTGFDIDDYIHSGEFGFLLSDKPIRLRLLVKDPDTFLPAVEDTPISEDQKITKRKDGQVILTATIAYTATLETWLLSQGDFIEVLAPKKLQQM